jgi:hypothetical protein
MPYARSTISTVCCVDRLNPQPNTGVPKLFVKGLLFSRQVVRFSRQPHAALPASFANMSTSVDSMHSGTCSDSACKCGAAARCRSRSAWLRHSSMNNQAHVARDRTLTICAKRYSCHVSARKSGGTKITALPGERLNKFCSRFETVQVTPHTLSNGSSGSGRSPNTSTASSKRSASISECSLRTDAKNA